MNIQKRKIEFVQEFLKLENEESLSRLEKLLKNVRNQDLNKVLQPMSKQELNKRIEQSGSDFKNNRFKKTSELHSKYE
ncbi:hypothetical protein BH23BAC3_BH23BAC3_31940 [soil metagenome]